MDLFRKALPAPDFADGLVHKVSKDVYGQWAEIQALVRQASEHLDGVPPVDLPETYAPFFIVASIVIDLQAARTLRGERKFAALRRHVVARLGQAFGEQNAEKLFSMFHEEWKAAIERGENPAVHGVASVLYHLLELPLAKGSDGEFQTDGLLMALGGLILAPVGFTKFALETYRVGS